MKSKSLKNTLNAHGWVGLFLSLPLFIIFWAGAITLFHAEIKQWSELPHYMVDVEAKKKGRQVDLNQLMETLINRYQVVSKERISLRFPNENQAHLRVYFRAPVVPVSHSNKPSQGTSNKTKRRFVDLLIDPYTGQVLTEDSPFSLSNFFYRLHYTLHLPQGQYIVGIMTLLFFVLLLSGVLLQLKNLIKHFFLYRREQNLRSKMKDAHNVVGVISLPYAFMYALSGVVLNLLIFVQIPSALVLYKGDINQITADAGFYSHRGSDPSESLSMPNLSLYVAQMESQHKINITGLNLFNYGDKSAVIETRGKYIDGFNQSFTRFYQVGNDQYPENMNVSDGNVFSKGLLMLYTMHYADYAGIDMRIIYFLLAIAVCAMVIAGNVLWIAKRQRNNHHPKVLAITRGGTLGACVGVITATAFSFLAERLLPESLSQREMLVEATFFISLLAISISAFLIDQVRPFIASNFVVSGLALLLVVAVDWTVLKQQMTLMVVNGYPSLGYVSIGLFVFSILLLVMGWILLRDRTVIKQSGDLPQIDA